MAQLLLIPDARPLEQRLGRRFFRSAPRRPGVYLMKDAANQVLYVGKAKDLRQRLNNYRVANPDRMPRRHLRMVRQVERIEFQFCANESSALAREAKLLRAIKPKFNRAGVWQGKARFIAWRVRGGRLETTVVETPEPGWQRFGPIGSSACHLQRAMARLLWLALNPQSGVAGLPTGWAHGKFMETAAIQCGESMGEMTANLESFFWGCPDQFIAWLGSKFVKRTTRFEQAAIQSDLELLTEFGAKQLLTRKNRQQLALL
jgi:excinuclease UvrABC nuclease subunit